MAKSDILNLEHSIAPRLVRILYPIALLLITLGVIAGLAQGVRTATRIPTPPPMIAPADPAAAQLQATPPGPGMRGQGLGERRGLGDRRGLGPRRFDGGRMGPNRQNIFGLRPNRDPALFGGLIILRTLLMGAILVMVVRVLAEMALSVLALPRRETSTDTGA